MTTSLEFRVKNLETEAVVAAHKSDDLSTDLRELRHEMREGFKRADERFDRVEEQLGQILALLKARN